MTSVREHIKLDLSHEYLPTIVVFDIQALVAGRIMHILNFFLPNSGSPRCTQSSIIFSELHFHQEQLFELFVEDVLGDLFQQKRIRCESEENDSCSVDSSLTSVLQH